MSTPLPVPLRLPALLLAGALAACEALEPLPALPIVEQPNYGTLPGPGTYALVAGPGAGNQAPATPPLHDADGPAAGLTAPQRGTTLVAPEDSATLEESLGLATPAPVALAPEDRRTVEAALARALEQRGYRLRPPPQAAWHVSVDGVREQRREYLASPAKQMLLPRMRCDPQGCMITQQWEHFGPPLRGEALRRYLVDVVEVRIRHGRSGELAWQGRLSSEPGDDGHASRPALEGKLRRLLRELPAVPRHNPLPEPESSAADTPVAPR